MTASKKPAFPKGLVAWMTQTPVAPPQKAVVRTKPADPRCDHRKMLIDAEARHWRVLGYVSRAIGRRRIGAIEGCSSPAVQRSYVFLRERGMIVIGLVDRRRQYVLTDLGAQTLADMEKK